jgi:hypothetical protein
MRIEHDLPVTNMMRVMRNQNIPLASNPKPKDTNSMRMESKEPNLLLSFNHNILTDLMHELMFLLNRQIPIDYNNHTVFMALCNPTGDVHLTSSMAKWATILNDHPRWRKWVRINSKVGHGVEKGGRRREARGVREMMCVREARWSCSVSQEG